MCGCAEPLPVEGMMQLDVRGTVKLLLLVPLPTAHAKGEPPPPAPPTGVAAREDARALLARAARGTLLPTATLPTATLPGLGAIAMPMAPV